MGVTLKFFFDYTFSELFYFLHYLKSVKEAGNSVELYFKKEHEDEFNSILDLLKAQEYLSVVDYVHEFPKQLEDTFYIVDKTSINESNIMNMNRVAKYHYFLKDAPYINHLKWLEYTPKKEPSRVVINIDFNYDAKYFNHVMLYEHLLHFKDIYFLGTDVQFLSYTRDILHGKYKPEFIDFDDPMEVIKFLSEVKYYYGTYSRYLPIAQSLGLEQVILIANNETVNCLVGKTIGYNV